MRKSAQTFLRRAALTTRAMHACRVAGSCHIAPPRHDLHARRRHTATRTTALAHLHAKSPTRPPAMPLHGRVDRHSSQRRSTGAGTHRAAMHRRYEQRTPHRRCPRVADPRCASMPRCTCAASENRRRPTRGSSASVTARRDGHAALAVRPTATSHGLRSDARGDARSGIAMQRMALPTRERWRTRRAPPKKKPAALGGRFGCRDGRSAQWPSSSSSSAYSSGDSSSFNCSASSASSTRIQPSP